MRKSGPKYYGSGRNCLSHDVTHDDPILYLVSFSFGHEPILIKSMDFGCGEVHAPLRKRAVEVIKIHGPLERIVGEVTLDGYDPEEGTSKDYRLIDALSVNILDTIKTDGLKIEFKFADTTLVKEIPD